MRQTGRHAFMVRLAGLLALAPPCAAAAQDGPPLSLASRTASAAATRTSLPPDPTTPTIPLVACDGDTVTVIDIRSHAPRSSAAALEARAVTRRFFDPPIHRPSRPRVIAAYLRLAVGDVCTERNRMESERLLRAQPFIASAAVRAERTAPGHVRLVVDVRDEFRPIVGAGIRGGGLSSVLVGTQDYQGRGLAVAVRAERGFAYRDGYGVRLVQYGLLGRPAFLALDARRLAVDGQMVQMELAEPYLTDLQLRAFHAGASLMSGYTGLARPNGDDVALFVRRTSYDIGWVTRLRRASGRGTVALVGAALLGEDVRTSAAPVIISDTGFVEVPDGPFAFPSFATTRIAAIGGVRALHFVTVRGFDALTAEQDMGVGVQFDVLAGSSILTPAHAGDLFFASDFYAGTGSARSFVVLRAMAEARNVRTTRHWDGVVAGGRLAWYGNASGVRAHLASIEVADLQHLVFPAQLTFGDADGGLPGFGDAAGAGGRRAVARVEERRLVHTFGSRVDAAVGVFATAGKLWAGDVPYGHSTSVRASVGISLFGAYPAGGKRTYRADLAIPLNPERGGARFELRFSAIDRTRLLWQEPGDVARARTGAVPVSLMKW